MSLAYHQRIKGRRTATTATSRREPCSPLHAVRAAIENLTDDQVRGLVHTLVDGLVHAMIEDVASRADEVVNDITDSIIAVISAAAPQMPPTTTPARCTTPRTRSKDKAQRTCELCGRAGSRRFVASSTGGWRCAPTATKCVGHRRPATEIDVPQRQRHTGHSSHRLPPEAERHLNLVHTPGVTAQCQDCTRTWTLTGDALREETEAHELARGHITTVHEQPGELIKAYP